MNNSPYAQHRKTPNNSAARNVPAAVQEPRFHTEHQAIPTITLSSDPDNFAYTGQIVTFTAEPAGYEIYSFFVDTLLVQNNNSNIYQTNSLTNGQLVYVTVDNSGCVSLLDSSDLEIKPIPNAFTPDGNEKNDVFVPGLNLTIINRWDQVLYEGTDGWNGTYNGMKVSGGTYFYIMRVKDLKGYIMELKGSVTLIEQ